MCCQGITNLYGNFPTVSTKPQLSHLIISENCGDHFSPLPLAHLLAKCAFFWLLSSAGFWKTNPACHAKPLLCCQTHSWMQKPCRKVVLQKKHFILSFFLSPNFSNTECKLNEFEGKKPSIPFGWQGLVGFSTLRGGSDLGVTGAVVPVPPPPPAWKVPRGPKTARFKWNLPGSGPSETRVGSHPFPFLRVINNKWINKMPCHRRCYSVIKKFQKHYVA